MFQIQVKSPLVVVKSLLEKNDHLSKEKFESLFRLFEGRPAAWHVSSSHQSRISGKTHSQHLRIGGR